MKKIFVLFCIVALTGCTANQLGRVVGGSVGGLVGSSVGHKVGKKVGRVVGASVGAYLGSEFGAKIAAQMNKKSQDQYTKTSYDLLETGVDGDVGKWNNSADDSYGEFKLEKTQYVEELKTTCRDFTQTINHKGTKEVVKGTACRNPDGSWDIKS